MEQITTTKVSLKWGLIAGIASIVFMTILYVTGAWKITWLTSITYLILVGAFVLSMKEYKESNKGYMTYGQGLGIGMFISAITGILSAGYGNIYMQFIDTTFRSQMLDFQVEKLEEQGLPDESIEKAIETFEKFSSPGLTFLFGVIGVLFVGFLLSLVVSAVMKKNKPALDY